VPHHPHTFVDADQFSSLTYAIEVTISAPTEALPAHAHRCGQLVMVLSGGVTCDVEGHLLLAAPGAAIWIPPGHLHSARFETASSVCVLFVKDGMAGLPTEACLLVPGQLLGEMIKELAKRPAEYPPNGAQSRLVGVTLDLLRAAPTEQWTVPVPQDRPLRVLLDAMLASPRERGTAAEWAERLAMSERTFTRRVMKETGMPFGRWRQQLHLMLAMQWLRQGASVQRVADDLGYESVTGFILMFRKALGKPPAQYVAYSRA